MKRAIETDEAPPAVDADSRATTNGPLSFRAGQIPLPTEVVAVEIESTEDVE